MNLFLHQLFQVFFKHFLHDFESFVIAQVAMLFVVRQELSLNLDRNVFFGALGLFKTRVLVHEGGTRVKQAIAMASL